ncbi:MAG: hypothetical protein WEB19_03175 [Acidimicrobiia bacterium]
MCLIPYLLVRAVFGLVAVIAERRRRHDDPPAPHDDDLVLAA